MDFNVIWYILVGVLLMGYAVLDGFDLGVGALHLFAKTDDERRIMLNSIGPVWDGNEVWLITAGGALFAAFPEVYATAFSGFYLPFMLVLVALIFRAVSIEFRSKEPGKRWRASWDRGFSFGSILASILFGVAIGNLVLGIKIGADREYAGTFWDLISPFTVLTGLFTLSIFALHGSLYLIMKTEGDLQARLRKLAIRLYIGFVLLYALVTVLTLWLRPEMLANFSFGLVASRDAGHPFIKAHITVLSIFAWAVVLLNALAIANVPRCIRKGLELQGFLTSVAVILAVVLFFALGIFPDLLISSIKPAYTLDIYNGASSHRTLQTMFWVAVCGLPFVLGYTSLIYWTYHGKTKLTDASY